MKQVQFVETREHMVLTPVKNHYEFKPKGRLQALQRWAWRFLWWRGAMSQAFDETSTYTRHVIDTDDVVTRLIKQRSGLLNGYNREPKELLIGAEDFAELMGSPMIRNSYSFGVEYCRDERIMGLRVTVVPWMSGMLVMP